MDDAQDDQVMEALCQGYQNGVWTAAATVAVALVVLCLIELWSRLW